MLGHLVNASGSVELALTALALRDGFAPPTLNLTHPDPQCDLDCVPLVGRMRPFEHAIKLSIAFGGHLAAIVLRRWDGAEARAALPVSMPVARASPRRLVADLPLPPQDVMVVLGEAVRFVAHVLQQPQRIRAAAQSQRLVAARHVQQLFLLGEREDQSAA